LKRRQQTLTLRVVRVSRLIPALLLGALATASPARADAVVGTGTPASCTEAALDAALLAGGMITFECGAGSKTIALTAPKTITTTVALDGGGTIVLSGQNAVLPFTVLSGGSLTLQSLTVADGVSSGDGGCLLNLGGTLTLMDTIVHHCTAAVNGGGICNGSGTLVLHTAIVGDTHAGSNGGGVFNLQSLTMDGVAISGCSAVRGGGLSNGSGTATLGDTWIRQNQASNGGGIANSATLVMNGVTLSGNTALTGAGGGLDNSGSATVTNCTFTTNTAALGGGGIMQHGGSLSLLHTTMLDDGAPAGGSIDRTSGTVSVRSSVLAAASGGCCAGTVTSNGNNVASDASCALAASGDQSSTDPLLVALADNSGPTPTCLPMDGSPVIDTATGPGCPATDQRGEPRPAGPACDAGAVEIQTTTSTSLPGGSTVTSTTVTTSSTLPDPCAGLPATPTFPSIGCRLDALNLAIVALGDAPPRASALRERVGQAMALATDASTSCAASDAKSTRKMLKGSLKKLGRLRKLLKASKTVPTRDELVTTVDALRTDVRGLRATLACPPVIDG
jgi:hypothetical protein